MKTFMIKHIDIILFLFILLLLFVFCLRFPTSQEELKKEQEVACSVCNGSGKVKYYFGNGDNDFNMGVCASCDGKGVKTVIPSGNSSSGGKICSGCEKYVKELITKKDIAGENRTWCADCWKDYDNIMGR